MCSLTPSPENLGSRLDKQVGYIMLLTAEYKLQRDGVGVNWVTGVYGEGVLSTRQRYVTYGATWAINSDVGVSGGRRTGCARTAADLLTITFQIFTQRLRNSIERLAGRTQDERGAHARLSNKPDDALHRAACPTQNSPFIAQYCSKQKNVMTPTKLKRTKQ